MGGEAGGIIGCSPTGPRVSIRMGSQKSAHLQSMGLVGISSFPASWLLLPLIRHRIRLILGPQPGCSLQCSLQNIAQYAIQGLGLNFPESPALGTWPDHSSPRRGVGQTPAPFWVGAPVSPGG